MMKQLADRKRKEDEFKQRERQARASFSSMQRDAAKRTREFEKKSAPVSLYTSDGHLTQMARKAYYREFRKVVDAADVVLQVLDARDPLSCRCVQVEESVLASPNKRLILVLNKIDLIPREQIGAWLKHLRNEFPTVAIKSSTQGQKDRIGRSKASLATASEKQMSGGTCIGADSLMKLLSNYCRNAGIKTTISVGVVGFPNVGKSSLINSLKRSRACSVGATAGVTKTVQEVQLDKHIKLLDSPGIVMAKDDTDAHAALHNSVQLEKLTDPITPVGTILRRCNQEQMMQRYFVPAYTSVQEFLAHLAQRLGKLRKGGIPDLEAAARSVLKDWNSGAIKFFTHPPEQSTLPAHLSAQVVSSWGKEFDMASLLKDDSQTVEALSADGSEEMMAVESGQPLEMQQEDDTDDADVEDMMSDDDDDFDEDDEDDDEEEMSGDDDEEAESEEESNQMTVVVPSRRKRRSA
eukprot:scpid66020/ scgid34544/ Guanine nucleotide-binding protein-like 3-like protein